MSAEARSPRDGGRDGAESAVPQPYPPQMYPMPGYQGHPPPWFPGQPPPPGAPTPWGTPWSPPISYPQPNVNWSSPQVPTTTTTTTTKAAAAAPSDEYTVDTMRRIYDDDDGRVEIQRVKVQRRQPDVVPPTFPSGPNSMSVVPAGSFPLNERRPPPRKHKRKQNMQALQAFAGHTGPYPWYPYMPCMPSYPYPYPYYVGGCMWPPGIPGPMPWPNNDDDRSLSRQDSLPATLDSQRLESRVSVTSRGDSMSPISQRSLSPATGSHIAELQSIAPSDSVSVRGHKREATSFEAVGCPTPPPRTKSRASSDRKSSDTGKAQEWLVHMQKSLRASGGAGSDVSDMSSLTTTTTDIIYKKLPPRRKNRGVKIKDITDKSSSVDQGDIESISDKQSVVSDLSFDDDSLRLGSELTYAFKKLEQSVDVFKTKVSVDSTPVGTPSPNIVHSSDEDTPTGGEAVETQPTVTITLEDTDKKDVSVSDSVGRQPSPDSFASLPNLESISEASATTKSAATSQAVVVSDIPVSKSVTGASQSTAKVESTSLSAEVPKSEPSNDTITSQSSVAVSTSASLEPSATQSPEVDKTLQVVQTSDAVKPDMIVPERSNTHSVQESKDTPTTSLVSASETSTSQSTPTESKLGTQPPSAVTTTLISSDVPTTDINSVPQPSVVELMSSQVATTGVTEVVHSENLAVSEVSGRDSRASNSTFFSTRPSDDPVLIDTDSTDILLPTTDVTTADESGDHSDWTAASPVAEDAESYQWVLQQPGEMPDIATSDPAREDERRNAWRAEVSLWRARLVVSLCRGRGLDRQDWATFHLLVHHPLTLDFKLSLLHAPRLCTANSGTGAALVRVALIHLAQYGETLLQPEQTRQAGWRTIKLDPNQSWAPVKGAVELLRALGYRERGEEGSLRYPRRSGPEVSVLARLTLDMLVLAEELRLYLTGAHQYPTNISDLFFPVSTSSVTSPEMQVMSPQQDLGRPPSSVDSYSFMSAHSNASLSNRVDSRASVTDDDSETLQASVRQVKHHSAKIQRSSSSSEEEKTLREDVNAKHSSTSDSIANNLDMDKLCDEGGENLQDKKVDKMSEENGKLIHENRGKTLSEEKDENLKSEEKSKQLPIVEDKGKPEVKDKTQSENKDKSLLEAKSKTLPEEKEEKLHAAKDEKAEEKSKHKSLPKPEFQKPGSTLSLSIPISPSLDRSSINSDMTSLPDLQSIRSSSSSQQSHHLQVISKSGSSDSSTPIATPVPDADTANDNPEEHIYEEIDVIRSQVQALRASSVPAQTPPPPLPPKKKVSSGGEDDSGLSLTYPHMEWTSASTPASLRGGSIGARRKKRRAPMPPDFMPPNWKPYQNQPDPEPVKMRENTNERDSTEKKASTLEYRRSLNPFYEDIDSVKAQVKELSQKSERKHSTDSNPFTTQKTNIVGYVGRNPFYEDVEINKKKSPESPHSSPISKRDGSVCAMGSLSELQDDSVLLRTKRKAPKPPPPPPRNVTTSSPIPQTPHRPVTPQSAKQKAVYVNQELPDTSKKEDLQEGDRSPDQKIRANEVISPKDENAPPLPIKENKKSPSVSPQVTLRSATQSPKPGNGHQTPTPQSTEPPAEKGKTTEVTSAVEKETASRNQTPTSSLSDKEDRSPSGSRCSTLSTASTITLTDDGKQYPARAIRTSQYRTPPQHPRTPPPPPPSPKTSPSATAVKETSPNTGAAAVTMPPMPPPVQPLSVLDDIPYMDANEVRYAKAKAPTDVTQSSQYEIPEAPGKEGIPVAVPLSPATMRQTALLLRGKRNVPFIDDSDIPPDCPPPPPPTSPPETPHTSPPETPHTSPPETPHTSPPETPHTSPPKTPHASPPPSPITITPITLASLTPTNKSNEKDPVSVAPPLPPKTTYSSPAKKAEATPTPPPQTVTSPMTSQAQTASEVQQQKAPISHQNQQPESSADDASSKTQPLSSIEETNQIKAQTSVTDISQSVTGSSEEPVCRSQSVRSSMAEDRYEIPEAPTIQPSGPTNAGASSRVEPDASQEQAKSSDETAAEASEAGDRYEIPQVPKPAEVEERYEIPEVVKDTAPVKEANGLTHMGPVTVSNQAQRRDLEAVFGGPPRPPRRRRGGQTSPPPRPPKPKILEGGSAPPTLPPKVTGAVRPASSSSSFSTTVSTLTRHSGTSPSSPPASPRQVMVRPIVKSRRSWPFLFCDCLYANARSYETVARK